MAAWDETKPAGTDAISAGDDSIRTLKTDIRERMDNEHSWTATGDNTEAKHSEGSARITTDTSAPANVDDGRLYYDTTNKLLKFANGSAFANLDMDAAQVLAILGYKFVTAAGPQVLTASYADFVSTTITKKETSSVLVVFGKFNTTTVTQSAVYGQLLVDGSTITDSIVIQGRDFGVGNLGVSTFTLVSGVTLGSRAIKLQVKTDGGTGSAITGSLMIFELRNPFTL